jgi:alkylation response protein AidB-like acyl-CoA dehydrogenase
MIDFNLPYLDDEQKSLAMLMKEFCEREVDLKALNEIADATIPPNATSADLRARMPWDVVSKAHDAGLRQITAPVEYGGGGYEEDHLAQGVMAEMAGYMGGQFGRLMTITWKQLAAFAYAPKEIAEEVLGDFMKDRKTMMAASITEPNSGSDFLMPYDEPGAAGQYIARQEGNEWVFNGDKMFCTAGGVSNYITVMVRTEPKGPISKSVTQFVLDTRKQGWSIARVNDMMGNELVSNVQIHFENYRLPDKYRVSPVNGAFGVMKSRLAGKSLHMFAVLGWAERTWEDMKEYAMARVQGGKPIIQHSNVGTLIAETDCLLRTTRLLLYQDAWEWHNLGQGQMRDVLGWYYINWYIKKVLMRLIEAGMEIYGGMAPQKELTFEHWVRVHLSIMHGGSTGLLSLVKAAKIIGSAGGAAPKETNGTDALYES